MTIATRSTAAALALALALMSAPADARKAVNPKWERLNTFCTVVAAFGLRAKACRGFR